MLLNLESKKHLTKTIYINHEPDCWGRLGSNSRSNKNTAHNLGGFLKNFSLETSDFNYTLLFLPILGIISTVIWNKYLVKKPESNGFPTILYAIAKRSGIMKRHHMFSSIVSSILTAGFGGSIGMQHQVLLR